MGNANGKDSVLDETTVRRSEVSVPRASTLEGLTDGPCLVVFEADGSRVHALPPSGEIVVGRGDVDVRLADTSVSRRHARIVIDQGEAWLHDLDSQNGTLVNGERIGAPRALVSGDLVTICGATLVYRSTPTRPRSVLSFADLRMRTDEELARAHRHRRPLTIVCANVLSPTKSSRADVEGALGGGLRRGDIAAWAGDDQLLVVLPETTHEASTRVTNLLAPLARVGCVTYPSDGSKTDELLAAARAAAAKPTTGASRPRAIGRRSVVIADPVMERLYALAERLAAATLPVLVYGETGTGKELLATALHELSPRRAGPFITLNCAAVHDTLFESELFGYQKGAFTGAATAKPGLIERADGGTLFLDEVGDMPATTQTKLLRVLETKRTMRLGAVEERAVDFRLVTATNRDLEDEVRANRFRADLYFRVSGGVLRLPPLRERRAEIPLLAQALLDETRTQLGHGPMRISTEAMRMLEEHTWPGNVRELKNLIDYVAAANAGNVVEAAHVAERLPRGREREATDREPAVAEPPRAAFRPISEELDQLEERRMRQALDASGGNVSKAATLIGMPNRTFFKRMKKYGLSKERES